MNPWNNGQNVRVHDTRTCPHTHHPDQGSTHERHHLQETMTTSKRDYPNRRPYRRNHGYPQTGSWNLSEIVNQLNQSSHNIINHIRLILINQYYLPNNRAIDSTLQHLVHEIILDMVTAYLYLVCLNLVIVNSYLYLIFIIVNYYFEGYSNH